MFIRVERGYDIAPFFYIYNYLYICLNEKSYIIMNRFKTIVTAKGITYEDIINECMNRYGYDYKTAFNIVSITEGLAVASNDVISYYKTRHKVLVRESLCKNNGVIFIEKETN